MRLPDPNPRSSRSSGLLLGAVCLLVFTLAGAMPVSAQCGPNDFVTVRRGNFECNRQPFRFVGANHREMVHLWPALFGFGGQTAEGASQVLYDQFTAAEEMGVTVMRVYLPREEKGRADFTSLAEYHRFLGDHLEMLMSFATEQNPTAVNNPGLIDYQSFRPGAPPAPSMKFLVSLTDSIYDPTKGGFTNAILKDDLAAYPATGGLQFLDFQWYRADRRGEFLNYEDNYKPLAEYIVNRFKDDPRIFAWELGNEIKAYNTTDMRDFVRDMAGTIKRLDRNHLITSGFISACHAANIDPMLPCTQRVARTLYQPLDFGSVHMYNNEWNNPPCENCTGYLGQDVDMGFYFNAEFPYIVGELGFSTPAGSDPGFPGGTWYFDEGPITFESNRTEPRTNNIFWTLNALYEHKEADGVFPWAFFAGMDGANFSIDGARGMDQVAPAHSADWDGLFAVYQCRAWSLDASNRGLGKIDLAIQRIEWNNVSRPGQAAQVGDRIRFQVHVCNAGDVATDQGVGLSLFLDNNGANPVILESIGQAFTSENLSPGHVDTIELEWTAVDPNTLDSRLFGANTVAVGLVDDVNRYPSEITEANNGFAFSFPIQGGVACSVSLINPSFENPVISPPWSRVNSMPGWTGPVDIHRVPDLPASDGAQVVDLNQNGTGYIQQTFSTVPGQLYRVRFYHGVNYHCTSSARFSVDIDSGSIGTFTGNATPVEASATFTATGSSTTLRFRSLSGGCGASTIDHVRVSCQ